jgi:PASTA domain-containing protein
MNAKIVKTLIGLLVSVAAGLLVRVFIEVFHRLGLQDIVYLLALAVVLVLLALIYYARKAAPPPSFWAMAALVLAVTVYLLLRSTVVVPSAIGLSLADAKSLIVRTGLTPQEVEMVKGGSDSVTLQSPDPGTRRFRDSLIKLFFGQLPTVTLTQPTDGATVGQFTTVQGTSTGVAGSRDFHIYVLVRAPNNHNWIQDPPIVRPDGFYSVEANFGDEAHGRGDTFQVMTIITNNLLKVGDRDTAVPNHVASSEVIKVTRER